MPTGIPVGVELVDIDYLNEVARAHWRKTTAKDVTNTTTETDLLNGEVTIDADAMESARALRVFLICDYLNNTGANANLTIKVKLAGTTVYQDVVPIQPSANRRQLNIELLIANLGVANSQRVGGSVAIGSSTAPTVGVSAFHANAFVDSSLSQQWIASPIGASASVDTSAAWAVAVTATHGVASASLSARLLAAVVEVV